MSARSITLMTNSKSLGRRVTIIDVAAAATLAASQRY